jgi:voltage-gated potassium channel
MMRLFAPMYALFMRERGGNRARAMASLIAVFVLSVLVFAVGFHAIMAYEGRDFSWWTSVYWTIVTMSTLGFGDIVFESDLGRMYSVVVLLTGSVLILILLPFTFIQFVYLPWREAQRRARAPRELPADTTGHLVVTGLEPMEEALLDRARMAGIARVLLVEDPDLAISLHDQGYPVMVGALDDPETYRAARLPEAALLVAARSDTENTNIAFTAREVTDAGVVVATATSVDSVDVLQLAGCDHVLQLGELLGDAFARRILAPHARSREISGFEDLLIAEAAAAGTPLVGLTLSELDLREQVGVSIVAIWERGELQMARPGLCIEETSVLVLVGRRDQLDAYDALFADTEAEQRGDEDPNGHVVILGGGRVGRAAARALRDAGIDATIVERLPERIRDEGDYVEGDAADREVLERAGIDRATAVVITTHDDAMNIYLTIYCRRLRPDVEILGRVNLDRNLSTMHRAGADFVLSYASTGAAEAWNLLREKSMLLLAEGLLVFRVPVSAALAGRSLAELDIPQHTGCSVVGLIGPEGHTTTGIDPTRPLPERGELLLIGDERAEERFYSRFVAEPERPWWRPRLLANAPEPRR